MSGDAPTCDLAVSGWMRSVLHRTMHRPDSCGCPKALCIAKPLPRDVPLPDMVLPRLTRSELVSIDDCAWWALSLTTAQHRRNSLHALRKRARRCVEWIDLQVKQAEGLERRAAQLRGGNRAA